ncbi:MAG: hypothetical protein PHI37_05355 [Candidatus Gracilibacteria bacterium]|nr:hypothetical protein [Candidatus Gracilibacteria bacterium]
MNIGYLLEKFGDKKNVFTFFLISKDKENLLEFIKNNIDDDNFIEFVLNSLVKEDKSFLYKIIKNLDLEDFQEKLLIKISLESSMNLLNGKNKNIVDQIIKKGVNLENILYGIDDISLLDYLLNKSSKINNGFEKIDHIYNTISQDKKEIINNFFFKKVKNQVGKLNLNQILKGIRNKVNTKYSGNDNIMNNLSSSLEEFNKSYINNEVNSSLNSNFPFQFKNEKNQYFDYEIFIISNIENKNIYLNFINSKENLSSDIFKNAGIGNKSKNKFLGKIEKLLLKKVAEIDDGFQIICNSFILTKGKENLANNVFNSDSDCVLLIVKTIFSDEEKLNHDKKLKGLFDFLNERERKVKQEIKEKKNKINNF